MKDIFKANIPIRLKWEVFDRCTLPVMTYGAESLTLTKTTSEKLRVAQGLVQGSMLGLTLRDRVKNNETPRRTGVVDIVQ
ncbi:hypothetical protein Trydic_g18073 [Trypoxylus dichotomus]